METIDTLENLILFLCEEIKICGVSQVQYEKAMAVRDLTESLGILKELENNKN